MIASNKMENILISMGLQVGSMIVTCILQQYSHNNIIFSIGFDLASHDFFLQLAGMLHLQDSTVSNTLVLKLLSCFLCINTSNTKRCVNSSA